MFLFFAGFFIVIWSLCNFLLDDLKKTEETFLNYASMKYLIYRAKLVDLKFIQNIYKCDIILFILLHR
jgi:hypothetical protein